MNTNDNTGPRWASERGSPLVKMNIWGRSFSTTMNYRKMAKAIRAERVMIQASYGVAFTKISTMPAYCSAFACISKAVMIRCEPFGNPKPSPFLRGGVSTCRTYEHKEYILPSRLRK